MKKLIRLFLSLSVIVCLSVFTANAKSPNIVDNADLLTSQQEYLLETTTDVIRDDYSFEVVVVTVESTEGKSIESFADDYYDYNGYGVDAACSGVIFVVDMGARNWFISTSGTGIELIAEGEISYIEQEIIPYLSDGDYSTCFSEFIDTCQEILELDSQGEDFIEYHGYDIESGYSDNDGFYYEEDYYQPQSFSISKNILIALVIGFIIAFIIVMTMKGKLKTVRAKSGASDYVVPGSMNVTHSNEVFLYRHVTRTPKQQNNSNGRSGGSGGVRVSSSGRSHGGRGGSF